MLQRFVTITWIPYNLTFRLICGIMPFQAVFLAHLNTQIIDFAGSLVPVILCWHRAANGMYANRLEAPKLIN